MVSSQVQYYVKSSDLKKKNISKDMDMLEYCIQGKSCRRALLYSYFDSNVTDVSGCSCLCYSLVCVLIVSVIVSPSALLINMYIMDGYNVFASKEK